MMLVTLTCRTTWHALHEGRLAHSTVLPRDAECCTCFVPQGSRTIVHVDARIDTHVTTGMLTLPAHGATQQCFPYMARHNSNL
jgi:hypothetical protein